MRILFVCNWLMNTPINAQVGGVGDSYYYIKKSNSIICTVRLKASFQSLREIYEL